MSRIPDSKIHGANMEPTWVLSSPGGFHVGPMNLAIWDLWGRLHSTTKGCIVFEYNMHFQTSHLAFIPHRGWNNNNTDWNPILLLMLKWRSPLYTFCCIFTCAVVCDVVSIIGLLKYRSSARDRCVRTMWYFRWVSSLLQAYFKRILISICNVEFM